MKMYIPSIGDELVLKKAWTFDLYNENRNATLMEKLGDSRDISWGDKLTTIKATLLAGSVLKIDRIYIRKGMDEFSSVTFLWKGETTDPRKEERTAVHVDAMPCWEVINCI